MARVHRTRAKPAFFEAHDAPNFWRRFRRRVSKFCPVLVGVGATDRFLIEGLEKFLDYHSAAGR